MYASTENGEEVMKMGIELLPCFSRAAFKYLSLIFGHWLAPCELAELLFEIPSLLRYHVKEVNCVNLFRVLPHILTLGWPKSSLGFSHQIFWQTQYFP